MDSCVNKKKEAGWTLIELMVVMVIIATMTAWAIPAFQRKIMSGRLEEAKAMIMAIEARQKIYYNQNGSFYGGTQANPIGNGGVDGDNEVTIRETLGVDLRDSRNFRYELRKGTSADAPTNLNLGANDQWFRVRAFIVAPGAIDANKGTGYSGAEAHKNMTLQPEWTTADGSGEMTDANNYLIYEYPHRTAAAYAGGTDELAEKGWENGYNALNVFVLENTAAWAY